jgi:hypothetical protein
MTGFEDLLEMQAERSEPAEKLIPVPKIPLTEKIRLARISANRDEIEQKYATENLPEQYFFSETAELVLNDEV